MAKPESRSSRRRAHPPASSRQGAASKKQRRLARRGALHRAPRIALDRRKHLQGQGRQRPARPRGGVRRHRPREERLPARRRHRHPGRRGRPPRPRRARQGQAHHRAAQARPGDPRPGDQGPAEDQGPAPVDAALDRRALPRVRAAGRGRRRVAPARRQGARPPAHAPPARSDLRRGRRDRPHRRPGRHARGLRARDQVPAQAARRAPEARRGDGGAGDGLPGGRPVGARRARHLLGRVREGDRRRRASSTTGSSRSSPAPRRSCSSGSSSTRTTSRCSSATASRRRSSRRCKRRVDLPSRRLPDDRLRRGDDGDRRQLGLVHRPRQGREARGHDHEDQPRGRRGGRAPAAAARHRRDHRHRLHRHVAGAQPRRGAEDAAQVARRGPHQDLRGRDLAARAGRDDAPERHRRRARDPHQALPDLRGRGRGAVRGDGGDRGRPLAARARRRAAAGRGVPDPGAPAGSPAMLVGGPGVPGPIVEIEQETGSHFHFEGTEALPIDHFEVVLEGSARRGRGARAAVPRGRGGARPDRGAAHVQRGRRRRQARRLRDLGRRARPRSSARSTLVRIEKVGRSAAQASLVNPPEGLAQSSGSGESGSGDSPRPRRRGRRGGRGRKRPAAEAGTPDA